MPGEDTPDIIRASNYVRHGQPVFGDSFRACTCPKEPCGGVVPDREDDRCPEHRRTPAQRWHWAAACPASGA